MKTSTFKVSYQKEFGEDGTCYRQTISVDMDFVKLDNLNKKLADIRSQLRYGDTLDGNCIVPENIKRIDYGKNFLTITEFVVLKRILGWDKEKRVLDGRNTIFKIKDVEI